MFLSGEPWRKAKTVFDMQSLLGTVNKEGTLLNRDGRTQVLGEEKTMR